MADTRQLPALSAGQFTLNMTFTSKKGTGTGEIDVVIRTVDGIPVGEGAGAGKGHNGNPMQDHCPLCNALLCLSTA